MIRFLERKQIDVVRWDNCVAASAEGQIFFHSWYLDVCCPGWCALIEEDYSSVFPIFTKKKFGVSYAFQPFFTRHFGLIHTSGDFQKEASQFLNAIPATIRFLDICLHESHSQAPDDCISEFKKYQYLNLQADYAVIHDRYNENHKRSIRKAEKSGLAILPDYNPEAVVEQFRIHSAEKDLGFEEGDYKTLRRLMKSAASHVSIRCWAVQEPNGKVIAGAFFMESHQRLVYLKGFSAPEGRKCGAMHFLFDRIIRTSAGKLEKLDFGGSNDEGVARFYQGFGSVDCLYLHLRWNRLPQALRWIKR